MHSAPTLVLVDGSSLAFRSFYALFTSGLRTSQGQPSWAVYGFFNSLFDLMEKYAPHSLAVCFDLAAPTFRHTNFGDYKANRQEMPDDLSVQWPIIKEGVEILGIPVFEMEGYEADDLIGTIAKKAEQEGTKVQILTGDHDAFQLLDNSIQVLMPGKKGIEIFGRNQVYEKLGVWPEQIIDYKGLCGDTSDNIPGVKGIGKVTAAKLLNSYKDIEDIYAHIDEIKQPALKQKLIDGKANAFMSKELATIVLDVPLSFQFDNCELTMPNFDKVIQFFQTLEFKTIVNRLPKILSHFSSTNETETAQKSNETMDLNGTDQSLVSGSSSFHQETQAEISANIAVLEASNKLSNLTTTSIISTEHELKTLVAELAQCSTLALYLDTNGNDFHNCEIFGYAFAWVKDIGFDRTNMRFAEDGHWQINTAYLPIQQTALAFSAQLNSSEAMALLRPLLEDEAVAKIVHNAKLATNFLSVLDIKLSPIVFDPMLASYLLNANEKHGLPEQSERCLHYSPIRASGPLTPAKKLAALQADSLEGRALKSSDDARVTLELARFYTNCFDEDNRYLLQEMDLPLSMVLARMEQTGVALDLPYLEKFSLELRADLERLEREIYELANHPFNINSTQQLQKVLYEELGLKAKAKTKTGYSTDASVLESLKSEHAIIQKILDYRQLSKLRSTYVEALPKQISSRDHRLHGEFNQTVASTGRLSSSNPNLQNIPIRTEIGRSIRRAFIPGDKSSILLSADYSQIELRLLAHMCSDETLIDAFQKDQDIHARTAMAIFEVPIEQVTTNMRAVGKTMNFALIYQQGAYSTAQSLGISTKEAQAFIDKYFARLPKVRAFMSSTINEARARGYVTTLWGRKCYFRHLNDSNDGVRKADERAAFNAPLQGSAADLIKLAMVRLDRDLGEHNLNAKLILQVHDELVFEVPEQELDKTREVVIKAMQMDQPLKVPLRVDVGVGKNWMEAK